MALYRVDKSMFDYPDYNSTLYLGSEWTYIYAEETSTKYVTYRNTKGTIFRRVTREIWNHALRSGVIVRASKLEEVLE